MIIAINNSDPFNSIVTLRYLLVVRLSSALAHHDDYDQKYNCCPITHFREPIIPEKCFQYKNKLSCSNAFKIDRSGGNLLCRGLPVFGDIVASFSSWCYLKTAMK